jgi:hypothetical protein
MDKRIVVKRIPVTDLINVLIHFEKKGKKYVDLLCTINEEQDGVHVRKSGKKARKIKLTENVLRELLKHI